MLALKDILFAIREGAKNSGGKKAGLLSATGKHRCTPGGSAPDFCLFLSQFTDQWKIRCSVDCDRKSQQPGADPPGVYL